MKVNLEYKEPRVFGCSQIHETSASVREWHGYSRLQLCVVLQWVREDSHMIRIAIGVLPPITWLILGSVCVGQIRPYTPPGGQTLPNQLEYFRPQSGFLDQYNQFVAPKENLSYQLRNLSAQQGRDYQAVQNRINQSDLVRESEAAPTGSAAGFMNTSHYFGFKGGGGGAGRTVTPVRRYTPNVGGVGTGAGLVNGIGSGIGAGGAGIGTGYRPR